MKAEAAPAALGATASEKDAADEDVPRQWRGAHSAVAAPETIVAGTPAQWAALWARHAPGAPAPDVDFSRWAAVAVFAGEKPSGGHAVEILSVQDSGETVVVAFRESGPGADAFASQALTAPFHIRLIPKTRGQVRFRKVP